MTIHLFILENFLILTALIPVHLSHLLAQAERVRNFGGFCPFGLEPDLKREYLHVIRLLSNLSQICKLRVSMAKKGENSPSKFRADFLFSTLT